VNVHADILLLTHNGAPFGKWWCQQPQLTAKWAPFHIACNGLVTTVRPSTSVMVPIWAAKK